MWNKNEIAQIEKNSDVLFGFGEFKPEKIIYKINYNTKNNIRIGYVGTLAYNKLNKDFIKCCEKIIEFDNNVEFLLYGELESIVRNDIQNSIYKHKFICKGYCNDINRELLDLDIFGYPLNSENFATTENSILEAMAVGLPVVLLNQNTEKYIIENNISGLLAKNMEDYVDKILLLCKNINLRVKLGIEARKRVIDKFKYEDNLIKYTDICKSVMNEPKKKYHLIRLSGINQLSTFCTLQENIERNSKRYLLRKN